MLILARELAKKVLRSQDVTINELRTENSGATTVRGVARIWSASASCLLDVDFEIAMSGYTASQFTSSEEQPS